MKLVIVLLLALFLSTLSSDAANAIVRDVSGDNLQQGVDYYILPVIRGRGGGLSLLRRNNSCPFNVAQKAREVDAGLPVTFSPVEPKDQTIQLSTDLNIEFSAVTICLMSTVWELGHFDETMKRRYVTTGGVRGSPGPATVSNWFKIETSKGNDYKLVFCPSVCSICKVVCGDLGVFHENGDRWLGLGGEPFPVKFKKKQVGGTPSIVFE